MSGSAFRFGFPAFWFGGGRPYRRTEEQITSYRPQRCIGVARALAANTWARGVVLLSAIAVSLWSLSELPDASPAPALVGMLPWVIGKYVLCPLRWHALSVAGRQRRWHLRTYAESELLGLASPGHVGADLWRVHRLSRTGLRPAVATAEVAMDRLVGAAGLTAAVLLTGVALPTRILLTLTGFAVVVLVVALMVRWRRPDLLAHRPLPAPRVLGWGLALSLLYQATILGMLLGAVAAVGHSVEPWQLVAVFGTSQALGIVPGLHGVSPREGALVVGLTGLGLPWSAAFGAVSLAAVLAWVPALLLGGGSLVVRRLGAVRRVPGVAVVSP